MGVPKRLTEMQQRFAEFLVFGGPDGPMTQTEAALAAGYSPKRARQEGSELCNPRLSPLVVKYIGELKEERLKKHEVTYEGHVAELARLREAALKKGSFSSAVNAEANRGKAAGLYIDRKIIKELEDINRGHQELNGFLRVEIATWQKIGQEFESAKNLLKGYQSVIKDLTNRLNKKK